MTSDEETKREKALQTIRGMFSTRDDADYDCGRAGHVTSDDRVMCTCTGSIESPTSLYSRGVLRYIIWSEEKFHCMSVGWVNYEDSSCRVLDEIIIYNG